MTLPRNQTADQIKEALEGVDPYDPVSTSESVIPYFTDDSNKTKYLSLRATGFTPTESRQIVGVTKETLRAWRQKDEEFRRLDTTDILELRRDHGANFMIAEYQRNMRALMHLDWTIIQRANQYELEALTPPEQAYLKTIRPLYSAAQWGAMVKVVKGGSDNEGGSGNINMTQTVINLGQAHADNVRKAFSNAEETLYELTEISDSQEEERPQGTLGEDWEEEREG
jgi:hypothetical protein